MTEPERKPELSLEEKERRWSLLRQRLKAAGLSALLVYGGTQMGVPVHYLTRVWGNRLNMVFFPAEGEPVLLVPSNTGITGETLAPQGCWIPPENVVSSPAPAVDAARMIIKLKLEKSKVGIDSNLFWPVAEQQQFLELCPGVELVDCHRLFGEIRGRKSEEELAVMRKAILISDMAHFAFLANVMPGMTELEACGYANEVLEAHNVGDRIILIHHKPDAPYPTRPGNDVIGKTPLTFSPEFTRNAGYGAQMIRAYWWEEPQGVYRDMLRLCADMRQMVIEEFRPGLEVDEAGRKIERMVAERGFECDKLGHGVGLSYGDAPYLTGGPGQRDYMEWTMQAGEVYAVHPMIRARGGKAPFVMIGDMYHVREKETVWMTTTLPEIPVIIPR